MALSCTVFFSYLRWIIVSRDLEIWVKGHWRSFKLVSLESLGAVSYSPSIVTMAVTNFKRLWDIQRQRIAWPWKLGYGLYKVIENSAIRWTIYYLLVRHWLYLVPFLNCELGLFDVIWRWNLELFDLEIWVRGHSRSFKLLTLT